MKSILYICRHKIDKYNTDNRQSKYLFNVISQKALKKLSQQLPRGANLTIRSRLMSKFPEMTPFTLDYIRKVLDPDDPRKNSIILEEAILYRDELLDATAKLEARILKHKFKNTDDENKNNNA